MASTTGSPSSSHTRSESATTTCTSITTPSEPSPAPTCADNVDPFGRFDGLLGFGHSTWAATDDKGKAVDRDILAELTDDLDQSRRWMDLEPPASLYTISENCPPAVAEVAIEAINNITARAAAEKQAMAAEEAQRTEAQLAREAEQKQSAAPEDHGSAEAAVPMIIVDRSADTNDSEESFVTAHEHMPAPSNRGKAPERPVAASNTATTTQKKRRRAFARLLAHATARGDPVSGESSSAGAARGLLRNFYRRRVVGVEQDVAEPLDLQNADDEIWERLKQVQTEQARSRAEKEEVRRMDSVRRREQQAEVECVSCLDDFDSRVTVRVTCHNYCFACFERLIETCTSNEAQWPPKCCLNPIPRDLINRHCSVALRRTFAARDEEWSLPIAERYYCSRATCSRFIPASGVNLVDRVATCARKHRTCTLCRGEHHGTADCPQDRDLERINMLAEDLGWKRCIDCSVLVEHTEACQHMTCRCGAEFCYVCGVRWRGCQCSMADLTEVKQQAAARRVGIREEEAREAEELRRALEQVEEFEREEARKAELLRIEHERQQLLLRRILYARRKTAEQTRLAVVAEEFEGYREALDALGQVQAVRLETAQNDQREELKAAATAAQEEMKTQHVAEMEVVRQRYTEEFELRTEELAAELNERVEFARGLVAEYEKQLDNFYRRYSNGAQLISQAIEAYHATHEPGYHKWQTWRTQQLEVAQFHRDEQVALQQEALEVRERRLEEGFGQQAANMEVDAAAQKTWWELVVAERQRLLAEREQQARDGGDKLDDFTEEEVVEDEDEINRLLYEDDEVVANGTWFNRWALLEVMENVQHMWGTI